MKNFYQYLEQVATKSFVDDDIINNNGNDNNDDDDGDDEEWEWEKLKKYDNKLISWTTNDPYAKKIKNAILEIIFKKNPKLEIKEYFGDDDNEFDFSPTGEVLLNVEWKVPIDEIEDKLFHTLRNSTVWKPLEIQPNQLWNTLDKGDVFDYIYYHLKLSLLGINKKISDAHYHPNNKSGSKFDDEYFSKHKDWNEEKLNLEKYSKFIIYTKQKEFEKYVKDFFPFKVDLEKTKENTRSLIWQENFDISSNIWYRYKKVN
jgi:hypothetical protein